MRLYRPTFTDKKTGELKKVGKWWLSLKDHRDIIRRFPGFTDKGQTELLGRQIERLINYRAVGEQPDAQLARWLEQVPSKLRDKFAKMGLLDSSRAAAGKPLQKHVDDFEQVLLAKNNTVKYAKDKANKVRVIIKGCQFTAWSEIQPSKVEGFLANLRVKGLRGNGVSIQTSNFYLQAVRQFGKWMVQDGRANQSPIEHLKGLNVRVDRRHDRRALEPDEIRRLLEATAAGPVRLGMSGPERVLLYWLAADTGFRANELRSLTTGSFDFEGLTVTVLAAYSKHRRDDTQLLRRELAAELQEFLRGKLPKVKVFGGSRKELTKRTAELIKADLASAGIDYVDDAGLYADFQCLRHTTGTLLAAAGVHPKVAQKIMRHSKIDLTMSRYTHVLTGQEAEAVAGLPDFSLPSSQRQKALATGTDGKDDSSRNLSRKGRQANTIVDDDRRKQDNMPQGTDSGETALMQAKTPVMAQERRGRDSNPRSGYEPTGRFSKPLPGNANPLENQALTETTETDLLSNLSDHPDLAKLVKVWPDLPEHIKVAIKALIQTHITE